MSATKDWMLQISTAIEAAEYAIIDAAEKLCAINDLIYDGDEPMTRLSRDEIDCLEKARKWMDDEYFVVHSARDRKVS